MTVCTLLSSDIFISSLLASSGPNRPQLVRGSHVGALGGSGSESHQGAAVVLGSAESKSPGPAKCAEGHGPPQGPAALPESVRNQ